VALLNAQKKARKSRAVIDYDGMWDAEGQISTRNRLQAPNELEIGYLAASAASLRRGRRLPGDRDARARPRSSYGSARQLQCNGLELSPLTVRYGELQTGARHPGAAMSGIPSIPDILLRRGK
jgi:hypothetical protein